MSWRGVLFQTLLATTLWGLGMHLVFGWPREGLLAPMALFAAAMFAMLAATKFLKDRGKSK